MDKDNVVVHVHFCAVVLIRCTCTVTGLMCLRHVFVPYIHPLVHVHIPDLFHKVLEVVDCCNVVVVHFNFHIWVDPPGREERRREERRREEMWREEEGGEVEGGEEEGGERNRRYRKRKKSRWKGKGRVRQEGGQRKKLCMLSWLVFSSANKFISSPPPSLSSPFLPPLPSQQL